MIGLRRSSCCAHRNQVDGAQHYRDRLPDFWLEGHDASSGSSAPAQSKDAYDCLGADCFSLGLQLSGNMCPVPIYQPGELGVQGGSLTEHPSCQLMGQTAIGLAQLIYPDTQGRFEGESVTDLLQNFQCCPSRPDAGRLAHCTHPGRQLIYSSIPRVGLEGIATSRRGIRPARKDSRPASTAYRIAVAMETGSSASAKAVFIRIPSTPCSMVRHASEAVPTPASTITGTESRRLMVRMP